MVSPHRLTTDQVIDLIKEETGTELSISTFRGYVSRGQAPAPVEKIGRTPLWKRSDIIKWAHNRPGQGARTDIPKRRRRTP
jgi:predicted DNA-binding transcriptional regulator AlpA